MPNESENLDQWLSFNEELLDIGEPLYSKLADTSGEFPGSHAFILYLRKALNTLRGIQLLIREDLYEEAQALTRVIFELRVTFDAFVDMLRDDPKATLQRFSDAMILEKIKQLESVNYQEDMPGGDRIDRERWEELQAEINERYPKDEVRAMRRYGFTGRSVEARARATGHEAAYSIVYRNFSRNIHSSDIQDIIAREVLEGDFYDEFERSRLEATLYVAHTSAGGIIDRVNLLLGGPFLTELDDLGQRQTEFRESVVPPAD